jgi:hypothetical protein
MLQQSEALIRDSNMVLRPNDPKQMEKYRRTVENINFRAESVSDFVKKILNLKKFKRNFNNFFFS